MLSALKTGLKEAGPFPKRILAIVGVWGALMGVMLVHTLLATKQLHRRVNAITHTVSDIDKDTASVSAMVETNRISRDLLAASGPIAGTLGDLKGVMGGLSGKVDSILGGSTTIQTNSQAIEGTVVAARDTAAEINGSVKGIGKSLSSILATLRRTQTAAGEINGSTKGINAAVSDLLTVSREIDAGIGTSNQGIAAAALIVDALRADIGNILATMPDLSKHANSIDCSPGISVLSLLSGPGESCNR